MTRRTLSVGEAQKLVDAAHHGPDRAGMTGPERALCYRLALTTGLRGGELGALVWSQARLDDDQPSIQLRSDQTKNRCADEALLERDVAEALRVHRGDKPGDAHIFNMAAQINEPLRFDLAAAGIEHIDQTGKVINFHALRHSAITFYYRFSNNAKRTQLFARHADVKRTLDIYTHLNLRDRFEGLDAMPTFEPEQKGREQATATGTENAAPGWTPRRTQTGANGPRHEAAGSAQQGGYKAHGAGLVSACAASENDVKGDECKAYAGDTRGASEEGLTSLTSNRRQIPKHNQERELSDQRSGADSATDSLRIVVGAWPRLSDGARDAILEIVEGGQV